MVDNFEVGIKNLVELNEDNVSEQTEFQKAVEYLSTYFVGKGRFFGRTADELARYLIENYQNDEEQARVVAISNKIKDKKGNDDFVATDTNALMIEFFPDYNKIILNEVVFPSKRVNKLTKNNVEDAQDLIADFLLDEGIIGSKKYNHILSYVLVGINKIYEGQTLTVKDDENGEEVPVLSGSFVNSIVETKKLGDNSEVEFFQSDSSNKSGEAVSFKKAVLVGVGQSLTLKHADGEKAPRFAVAASVHGMVSFMEQKGIVDGVLAFNTKTPEFRSTLFPVIKVQILNMINNVSIEEKVTLEHRFEKILVKTVVIDGVSFSAEEFLNIKELSDLDVRIAAAQSMTPVIAMTARKNSENVR